MAPILIKIGNYRHRKKIAAFDFDWTLVKPKDRRRFPKAVDDWQWLYGTVPDKIRECYEKGYGIVVFTNQSKEWKLDQIKQAMEAVKVPLMVAVAMDKAEYKPARDLWDAVVGTNSVAVEASFFVGDALGRPGDWAASDQQFADAIGIKAVAPEDFFRTAVVS